VDARLGRIADRADTLHEAIRASIAQGLSEVLQSLGVPATPDVEIVRASNGCLTSRPLRIMMNGWPTRYPDQLLCAVYCYQCSVPLRPVEPTAILDYLQSLCAESQEGNLSGREEVAEFFRLAFTEVIKLRPDELLGSGQVNAYLESLLAITPLKKAEIVGWPPDADWLSHILRRVLRMRVSIADRALVTATLQDGLKEGQEPEDIAEKLVGALRPEIVEVHVSRDYLREITLGAAHGEQNEFAMLRDGLFYELGVRYPDLRFVIVDDLKPSSFRLRAGHLLSLPRVGLRADECLVNDTTSRLALLNVSGQTALNPANGIEASIINSIHLSTANSAGLTTWNQIGYMVLSCAAELRSKSWCFITCESVKNEFSLLEQALPALTEAVQRRFSVGQITRTLRSLVAEEISIRNLRSILELLLHRDYIVADASKYVILDDRLPFSRPPGEAWAKHAVNLAAVVRIGLKRQISGKYSQGGNSIDVYLLDPKIEELLSEADSAGEQDAGDPLLNQRDQEHVLRAVREAVSSLSHGARRPVVLTALNVRSLLRKVLAPEFPDLAVVGHQELSPDFSIQPIARVSLDS
jgi:flagellar biosynthesis component FlhA